MAGKHIRYVALMKAFGKAVRFYRNKHGFSQESLADKAQLDRSYMSQIERGIKNATLNSIWRISQALGVAPSDLLRLTEQIDVKGDQDIAGLVAQLAQSAISIAAVNTIETRTVLVVDDDQDICLAIGTILKDAGFQTKAAHSGLDAVRIVASEPVDAVVSDIRMANGNGFELLETIRKYYPNVPVFFITGYDDVSPEDAIRRGATGLFNKPFDTRNFVTRLKSSLAAGFN